MGIKKVLYRSLIIFNLVILTLVVIITAIYSFFVPVDFPVFYGAAQNTLHGLSMYTSYGTGHLPYWYFPWLSWIFLPLAIFSRPVAWILYLVLGFLIAFLSIHALADYYKHFTFFDCLYMASMMIWMGWLAILVGQMSFFLLGVAVLAMLSVGKDRSILSGFLFPLLLIKPHLFIIFIPVFLWLGGRKTLITAILFTLLLFLVETLIDPNWFRQWLELLKQGSTRVDPHPLFNFSTFPTLLGLSQNFLGSADLPFTITLIVIAAFVVFRFRSLPNIPLLTLALAASMFCVPRSYAYDLVLLIPAMVWLSEKWSYKSALLWAVCVIILILAHFSSGSYLVNLLVFGLCILKAIKIEKGSGIARSFWGKPLIAA